MIKIVNKLSIIVLMMKYLAILNKQLNLNKNNNNNNNNNKINNNKNINVKKV